MAGTRFIYPMAFSVAANGVPRVGAKLYFYETDTDTPQATYANPALTIPNTNPVIADALGQFGNIFLLLSPQYKVRLFDADDNQIWTLDPVGPVIEIGGTIPVGGMLPYGGLAAPVGFLLCYGQEVSRTIYAELFAAIGTRYGNGDSATTFNIPDKRGRVSAGRDDMGGAPANRLTSGVSGVDGLTVGASGGDQQTQLHTHTLMDPEHTHDATVADHHHQQRAVASFPGSGTTIGNVSGAVGPGFASGILTEDASQTIVVPDAATGITIADYGNGTAQNVQPTEVDSYIIFANA